MGYVHSEEMSQFVPVTAIGFSAGTWTLVVNSNVWSKLRTAADANFTIYIPVPILSSSEAIKGGYLKSIEVMYAISGANADDFAYVRLYKDTLQASAASGSGTLNSAALIATTCDTGHDGAAERKAQDEHRMVVTLDTPAWIGNNEAYHLEVVVDAAAGTNFYLFGAIINYTLRL